jgi:hypothetical protein
VERAVCEQVTVSLERAYKKNCRVHQNFITGKLREFFFIQVTTLVVETDANSSPRRTGGEGSVMYSKYL